MNPSGPVRILLKQAAAPWSQRQELTPQQADALVLGYGDTVTLQRVDDLPGQRRFGFYFPREYRDISWHRARAIFHQDSELDSVTLKRQPEGCYRLTFWHRPAAQLHRGQILANIRSLAPSNVATHATNGCPFYTMQDI